MEERILDTNLEEENELSLRPQLLHEYIGQKTLKDNLKIFIEAAKRRSEVLDHTRLWGSKFYISIKI